jgi:hypothetical protein
MEPRDQQPEPSSFNKIDPILPQKRTNRIIVLLLSLAMTAAILAMIAVYYLADPNSLTGNKRNLISPEHLFYPEKNYYPPVDWKFDHIKLETFQVDGKLIKSSTLSQMDYRYFFYSTNNSLIIPPLPSEYVNSLASPPAGRITCFGRGISEDDKIQILQEIEFLSKNIFRVRSHLLPTSSWVYYSDPNLELFDILKTRPDLQETPSPKDLPGTN